MATDSHACPLSVTPGTADADQPQPMLAATIDCRRRHSNPHPFRCVGTGTLRRRTPITTMVQQPRPIRHHVPFAISPRDGTLIRFWCRLLAAATLHQRGRYGLGAAPWQLAGHGSGLSLDGSQPATASY
jgi:hypothetical protein